MNAAPVRYKTIFGYVLIAIGVLVVFSSQIIVFPGLEILLGPEAIVGRGNVYRTSDGYLMTNPGAMIRWIASVAVVGIAIAIVGVVLLLMTEQSQKSNPE